MVALIHALCFEVVVELVRPLTDPPDVHTKRILNLGKGLDNARSKRNILYHLWSRTDREGVPLESCNLRNFDEDPVARAIVELGRLSDLETGDPAGKRDSLRYRGRSSAEEGRDRPVGQLNAPDAAKGNEPLPKVRSMEEKEEEVEDIIEVGEIEDEEVAAPSHGAHTAANHNCENHDQPNSCWVRCAPQSAKNAWMIKKYNLALKDNNSNTMKKKKTKSC